MAENFERQSVKLESTNMTTIYQAPDTADADRAILLGCLVANVNGTGSAEISLVITDSQNAVLARTAHQVLVPARSTLECLPSRVVLKRGEKIRAEASLGFYLEATLSALELISA